jgi:hypothetical protein
MVEEVSFGKLTSGSPYILIEDGFEDMPSGGVFDSYVKVGRRSKARFNRVENLVDEDAAFGGAPLRDGIMFDPRRTRFLRDMSHVVRATKKKGTDQMVREVYDLKTGQEGGPGGPGDLIRKFLKAKPPKHAMGGRTQRLGRVRKTRRSRK